MAGEIVCLFAGLEEDSILHFRENEAPTIIDYLDAIQVLLPTP